MTKFAASDQEGFTLLPPMGTSHRNGFEQGLDIKKSARQGSPLTSKPVRRAGHAHNNETIVEDAGNGPPIDLATVIAEIRSIASRRRISHSAVVRSYVLTALPLLAADIGGLAASGMVALAMAHLIAGHVTSTSQRIGFEDAWMLLPLLFAYWCAGLYPGIGRHTAIELRRIAQANTTLCLATGVALWASHASLLWPFFFGVWGTTSVAAVPVMRAIARGICARRSWWGYPAVVIGSEQAGVEVFHALRDRPSGGIRPRAVVDPSVPMAEPLPIAPLALVVSTGMSRADLMETLEVCRNQFPRLMVVSSASRMSGLWTDSGDCCGLPATELQNKLLLPWPRFIKRSTDVVVASTLMVLGFPVLVAIALAVKFSSAGPIFFGHARLGQYGSVFKAWKFRTMRRDADEILKHLLDTNPAARREWQIDHKLRIDPRVTRIGNLLRKTSLDELPQLWNVLIGNMSLVGPRPIVTEEIAKYGDTFQRYSEVLPGITGLWQVSGRNNTTYPERVSLDDYYVRNWSPWLDAQILARTVKTLLLREGAF